MSRTTTSKPASPASSISSGAATIEKVPIRGGPSRRRCRSETAGDSGRVMPPVFPHSGHVATSAHSVGRVINRDDVDAAASRVNGLVRRTPVLSTELPGVGSVVLKLEQLQHAGSFKSRGMLNRVRAAVERGEITSAGVVTASGGNAGLAAAYAAARESVPATVVVPETAPAVKVDRLRRLGASVQQVGDRYSVAYQAAVTEAERTGAVFCHAYDQPEMCAGNGTLALELLEQTSGDIDTVLVAVGGGGLIAGIATVLEGH